MKSGESTLVHHAGWVANSPARLTMEASSSSGKRSESITSFQPGVHTLRRASTWQTAHRRGPLKRRLAFHESGHLVLMEMLGLGPGLRAEISHDCGAAHWPAGAFDSLPAPQPDPGGIWAATAASVHHAGLMSELLHTGTPWRGPVFYPDQTDYLRADDMLAPTFGRHASGAHAFAQTVALNALQARWSRVEEIAEHLVEHGRWQFAPVANTNQISKT